MRTLLMFKNAKAFARIVILFLILFQYCYAQPAITSFTPTLAPIGATVTINGNNFSSVATNNIVYFGAVKASVSAASLNSLTVTVPAGASFQPITVTVNGLVAASTFPFTLTYSGGGAITSTSYEAKKSFSTGIFPQVVASGDFDGDGKPDMVTPNTNSNTITVLKNTSSSGIISFASKQDYATGSLPTNVAIADIDGDGKLDIAVVNGTSNTISIYKNTSNTSISFAAKIDFPIGASSFGIAIADFDGDGKQDIAATNFAGTVSILKNNSSAGNISFAPKLDFTIGANPYTITAGDLDGDNKADLVSTDNQSNTISILRNTSDNNGISFASRIVVSTNSKPSTAVIADFDGDGKQDIALGSEGVAFVSVYRNLSSVGNISLASKIDYATPGTTYGISAGDLNGDAKPDLISTIYNGNSVALIENTSTSGTLSFKQTVNYTTDTAPFYVIIQDVDGDGVNDFVSANTGSNTIAVFRNKLNASPFVPIVSSFTPTSAKNGDTVIINGNNFTGATAVSFGGIAASSFTVTSSTTIQAVVSNGANGNVSVTTPYGTGTLTGFIYQPIPVISSFTPQSGIVGSTVTINGNNFNSVASNTIVYFGAVKATVVSASSTALTVIVPTGATYQPITVTTNNFTAYSNKPFIVIFPGATATFIPETFATRVDSITNNDSYGISISDLDGDGKPDFITANYQNGTISIIKNESSTGKIQLGNKFDLVSGTNSNRVKTADLDGDGKQDILVTSFSSNYISIYRNTSSSNNISFATKIDLPTELAPEDVSVGDIDGDGRPDLVVVNGNSHTISIFRNTSNSPGVISFAPYIDFLPSTHPYRISIADMDNDGKVDLVIANAATTSSSVSVLRNLSTVGVISFAAKVDYPAGIRPYGQAVGDLDGDGKPDIAIINNGSSTISIFRNLSSTGIISLASKVDLPTGTFPQDISIADLDGDGKPDIAVTNTVNNISSVSVYKNTSTFGTLTFLQNADYPSLNARGIGLADIDGDGKPDIATANSNSISILMNKIAEAFITTTTTLTSSANPSTSGQNIVFTATVTAASGTPPGTVSFYDGATLLGTGTLSGNTAAYSTSTLSLGGHSISAKYIGNNGYATSTSAALFQVINSVIPVAIPVITYFTPQSGAVGTPVTITGNNFGSTAADNLVYFGGMKATVTSANANSIIVTVPPGTTNSPLTVTTNNLTAYSAYSFINTFPGGGRIYQNSFGTKITYPTYTSIFSLSAGDIDGDGKIDIIAPAYGDQAVSIYRNTSSLSNISFAPKTDLVALNSPGSADIGDIDGDGKLDIVTVSDVSKTVSIYRNNSSPGNISFATRIDYPTGMYGVGVAIGDIDGDGRPDIAVTNNQDNTLSIYRNTSLPGFISFAPKVEYAMGTSPNRLTIRDLNGDSKPEVIVANQYSNSISILYNISVPGSILFNTKVDFPVGTEPYHVSVGDVDGDGKPDIIAANLRSNSLSFLRNTGTATTLNFNIQDFPIALSPNSTMLNDLDGDGKPDLAVTSSDLDFYVLKNSSTPGSISFDPKTRISLGGSSKFVISADFNRDGKYDIAITNVAGLSVFKNKITEPVITSFTPASATNGATVLIKGSFLSGATSVTFGNTPAVSFTIQGDTLVSAVVGAGSSGAINIVTAYGTATLTGFTYNAPSVTATIIYTGSTTRCSGDSVVLNANTGAGLSYQWYKNAVIINGATSSSYTATSTGDYTVVISNNSTSATSNKVSVFINPTPTITSQGDTILISTMALNYQWYLNNNALAGEISNSLKVKKVGFYRVETSPDKSCWSASADFPILLLPGRLADTLKMEIYPNPAVGFFNVVVRLPQTTTVTAFVTITNALGNVVLQTNKLIFYGNEVKIPVNLNATGSFFVKVNVNGDEKTMPIILQ